MSDRADVLAAIAVRDAVVAALVAAGLPKCAVEVWGDTVRVEADDSDVEPAFDAMSDAFGFDDMTSRRSCDASFWIIHCREPRAPIGGAA